MTETQSLASTAFPFITSKWSSTVKYPKTFKQFVEDHQNFRESMMDLRNKEALMRVADVDARTHFYNMIGGHLREMPEKERLAYLVRFLWRSEYGWGREIISDVDCSGAVCWAFYLMGYNIRTTAHGIRHRLCNIISDSPGHGTPGDLAFWWRPDGSRVQHVAVYSDNAVLMNASQLFEDVLSIDEDERRNKQGQRFELGRVDWNKVAQVAKAGNQAHGVDTELKPLFGLFGDID